jgi:hypothetical protein
MIERAADDSGAVSSTARSRLAAAQCRWASRSAVVAYISSSAGAS